MLRSRSRVRQAKHCPPDLYPGYAPAARSWQCSWQYRGRHPECSVGQRRKEFIRFRHVGKQTMIRLSALSLGARRTILETNHGRYSVHWRFHKPFKTLLPVRSVCESEWFYRLLFHVLCIASSLSRRYDIIASSPPPAWLSGLPRLHVCAHAATYQTQDPSAGTRFLAGRVLGGQSTPKAPGERRKCVTSRPVLSCWRHRLFTGGSDTLHVPICVINIDKSRDNLWDRAAVISRSLLSWP